MKKSWQKVLSFALALVMVLGTIPVTAIADEVQQTNASALSDSMDGLSIAYPYNTETVQQSGTPVSRFEALTFESARNEVESAQMILSPNFDITSFELTMSGLKNEKGNIIPSWAFEVYIQHYVTISGSGNAPYWSDTFQMYNPTYSKTGYDGTYPDALIPQDAAITAGENKISAGKNGGIWVNLNVQNAAPGTYTGTATLTVNGTAMQIPVSVHIYDVSLPHQVHVKSAVGIWWDMVEKGEGYVDRNLADTYFDYLVSKRIMSIDAWSLTRWDDAFADYAATYLAVSPEISSYSLFFVKNAQGSLDIDALRTTLTTLINKNISLAQSGSNVDLFAKAYLYFGSICDEPRDDAEYRAVNEITAQLDSLKAELAPMLDAYPSIKTSFMNLKHLVTGPNPSDKTYADKVTGSFWNKETFIDDDYGSTVLTGDSYIYAPQYQWLNTDEQRALYANEEELWWYGCCHPIAPYPTYQINTPLVSARVESWMRYDYGIDGFVFSSVNQWGYYDSKNNNAIVPFDYWNSYVNNGTPGDQILVLPGSDYGVYGPIGTIRIENIREGNEDYEYLWMLQNEYGISDISAYTANLYSGVIADTDASIHYNNRKALLTKLEELSVAKNGATVIAPGNEGFVRGQEIKPSTNLTIELGNTEEVATLSFDYKVTSGTFNISLNPDWDNAFGYFAFDANGKADAYEGVSVEKLDDGYYHVTFQLSKLTKYNGNPSKNLSFLYVRGAWTDATGYIDNVQYVLAKDYVEVYRGREITPSTSLTLELGNTEELSSLSFDYKVLSGTFNISLNPDWDNAFGYFAFDANGNVDPYDGVTLETLEDGYIRVTFDLAALTKYSGNPGKALSFLYIRGSWTDATGYIDNIKYVVAEKPVEPENRGQEIISRTDLTIALTNTEEVTTLSFDYKLTGGTFNISLNPDWDNYFGYFAFDTNGNLDPYDGVTLQTLEDGYTRVTFDLAALTKYSGSPSKVLTFLYLRGAWSDATGYIDNVQLNAGEEPEQPTEPEIVTRGQEIAPSTDLTIELGNTEEISTLSFDYKVTSGTFNISLNPDWDNSFGYFAFDANGNVDPYDGVSSKTLDDGYIRVTFNLSALTKYSGNPSKALSFLYIRGGWTDATGYIDNVTFTLHKENEPGSGRVLIAADVHVSATDDATLAHLRKTLTYAKNNGVDLLIFNGDTVDVGNEANYAALDSIFTEVFGSPEQANVKFIFNMGNHEFYPTSACAHEETDYALQFSLFAQFASKWSDFTAEQGSIYLTEVNGISYIVAAPSDDWTYEENGKTVYCAALGGYHDNDIALIDSLIAQATAANPGEPVYLLSHHPWGETYGGASYGMPETKVVTAMKAVMEKYPHLVNVTSHTHFSSLHERSFAQDKWTTINTGMHTYGKYVDIETDVNGEALNYVNIDGRRYTSTDPEGKALHGATHFVWDVSYGEDSFTAKVFNMATETAYSYLSYTVPYGITAENKGEKFAYELSDRTAPTLTWSADDALTVELVKNGTSNTLNLSFNDADQFYATEGYRINVINAATGETLKTVLWASRFWAAQEKKDSYEITVDGVTQCSEYKVTVEAIDFYGNYSAAKLVSTVQSSGTVETETGLLLQKCNGTNADCSARDYSRIYFGTTPFTSSSDTLTLVVKTDCTSIKLRAVSNVSDDWEGSAVSKDLEDLGDSWKTATWTLSELIGSNDITTMNGFRIDSLVDGMDILMKDILINNHTDWVGEFQSNYHGVVTQQQIEVKTEEEVFRGQQIVSRTDLTIEFGNAEELATLSFDYKLSSGTFNISLNPDWDNAFGYFAFDANGNVDPYDGVTLETLEDGYTRVTFDLAALTKYSGNPSKVLTFLYLRGAWSDAVGYIDNIQFTVAGQPEAPENRGQEIKPSTDLTIELGNTEKLGTLSFDYKVLSGTFNISLNPDWDNAFGYFAFDANGNVDPYDGVTLETLEDGYTRVTFDLAALTKYNGNPGKALSFLYIRGAWTDATGYIDNIQFTITEKPVEPENRGQEFSVNTDQTIDLATTGVLGTLSFDYKITSGEAFNIALMPNWDSYFGYFAFDANGNVDPYGGVTLETLEDGYIRVTFDMDALTKVSGTPSKFIDFIYIRGGWTTANGYIDNIQWTEGCEHNYETVVKEPTFTEVGGNIHTCSKCGNSYVTEEIPAYTFQVKQWNVALADDIRANFHLNVDSRLSDAKIIVMGKTYDLSALNKTEKGDYELSVNVAAAQMTDDISIQIVYGEVASEELTYSIRQYAEKILTGTYSNTTKELVKAMLHYGAMAQTYFGYNTGNLANKDYVNTEAVEIPAVDTSNMVSGSADGIRFYGASLVFESKVAVRFYFVVDGDINSYTFSTGTPVAKNDMYYIEVPGINPQDYATDIVLTVNDTLTVTYSPLTYISRKAGADKALANLVKAMYAYHLAAKAYLNGVETLGVSYSFTGNEADRAGYAEGTVAIANAEAGQTYEFYWADKNGKLSGYRALGSVSLTAEQTTANLTVAENTMIPAGADRLIICITGSDEAAGTYLLGEKANTAELETKFAVISDVHTNYNQGENYLLDALEQFESEGVSYIIVTGDIGESDSDYAKYVSAVEKSNFSGLIFASIGNHDQTETGRKNFKTYAIYDGSTKTWVGIDNAPAYFAGNSNVAVELAGENLAYYVVTIGENAFIFMDQELTSTGNTPNQDNFSKEQLNFVEDKLYQYSATHNLFIIEHAPVEQLKIGDKFDPGYGGAIQLSAAYPNNQRFVDLLMEYTEAIWLSGHTHVQYDTGIMYVDKYYDASENLTDTAIAHAVHVSSLAQPRWYEGSSMKMPNDFSAASQGYVCYQYADDIVFEARSFKNYTPDSITYNANLFINEVNAVYSWAIPLETLTHDAPSYDEEEGGDDEVTLVDYAVAENGNKRAGNPTWEDTADGLKVTFAAASDRFEIKTGDQTEAFTNGYMVQFKIKTDLTSFDLGGSNYSGSRKTYIQVNLAASGDQYTVTDLSDGWKLVTIPMTNLGNDSIITEFAIRFYNTNAAGTFYLKELYIAPEMAQEVATDYAVAENGNKRAGSPTWEDTADGLKVTFAAASDRFEIKTGDQTEAFTNGYTVQFKIKTDLTSFDLGGSNYSGSRKTYIQVNLAASGDQYTVTDLGDGWKLVTIPMTNLGHSSIITEFAIRFYNTNAAGAFYLKDLNIIPAK